MKEYYQISKSELCDLLEAQLRLECLENDGVDNWMWYYEGKQDLLDSYASEYGIDKEDRPKYGWDFEDASEWLLKNYCKIKQAKWKVYDDASGEFHCSECQWPAGLDAYGYHRDLTPYCSYCGAKMKGEY